MGQRSEDPSNSFLYASSKNAEKRSLVTHCSLISKLNSKRIHLQDYLLVVAVEKYYFFKHMLASDGERKTASESQ